MSDDNIVNKKRNVHYHNLHYVYKHLPFSRSGFISHADYANYADSYITIARMYLRKKAYPRNLRMTL